MAPQRERNRDKQSKCTSFILERSQLVSFNNTESKYWGTGFCPSFTVFRHKVMLKTGIMCVVSVYMLRTLFLVILQASHLAPKMQSHLQKSSVSKSSSPQNTKVIYSVSKSSLQKCKSYLPKKNSKQVISPKMQKLSP